MPNVHNALQNIGMSVWKMQHDILKLWYDLQIANQKLGITGPQDPNEANATNQQILNVKQIL